jgi:hypothetical protein
MVAVPPPVFVVPFGPIVPIAAILIALGILAGATATQLGAGAGALLAGAVLYLAASRSRSDV